MTSSQWNRTAPRSGLDRREDDHASLLAVGRLALRHRRFVGGIGLAAALVVAGVTFMRPRNYTSAASFMPQASNNSLSRLSGFAAQFGFAMPTSDPSASPAFYASLLKSQEVLRKVVETQYEVAADGPRRRTSLVEIFDAPGRTAEQRRDEAIRMLLDAMMVSTGRETGTVSLEVTTADPALSQEVARRLLRLVSDFNLQQRQTNAGAERRFVEGRLREASDSLRVAQEHLQGFMQRNRDFRNAPSLMFEYDRLQRDVQLRQEVYSTLTQSYEQARIDEVRNTPVLTIIEPPNLPSRPDPRWMLVKGVLALLVGVLLATMIAAAREMIGPEKREAA